MANCIINVLLLTAFPCLSTKYRYPTFALRCLSACLCETPPINSSQSLPSGVAIWEILLGATPVKRTTGRRWKGNRNPILRFFFKCNIKCKENNALIDFCFHQLLGRCFHLNLPTHLWEHPALELRKLRFIGVKCFLKTRYPQFLSPEQEPHPFNQVPNWIDHRNR